MLVIDGSPDICTTMRHLLHLFVAHLEPLDTAEAVVQALKPNLRPNEFCEQLHSIYNETKTRLKQALGSAHEMVLTVELWSYRTEEPYLTVACHFVDRLGYHKSHTLETTRCVDDPTAVNIVQQLLSIADVWGIKEKIHTLITAQMPNMKEALANTSWTHMPCFAHTLDLAIKEAMKGESAHVLLKKCRKVVRFFQSGTEAEKKLRELQSQLRFSQKELVQPIDDGWLCSLIMLERLDDQYQAMPIVLTQRSKKDMCLNEQELKEVKNMVLALQTFRDATSMMKSKGFETISIVIPLLKKLMGNLGKQKGMLSSGLLAQCKKHFGNPNKHKLSLTAALDPRFKNMILSDGDVNSLNETLIKEQQANARSRQMSSSVLNFEESLTMYLNHDSIPEGGDPLAWWRMTGSKIFKDLSKIAVRKLGVVSTAIPLERAFEKDEMFRNRRKCLARENLDMILFLNSNWLEI